jgi:hypothetical protein
MNAIVNFVSMFFALLSEINEKYRAFLTAKANDDNSFKIYHY